MEVYDLIISKARIKGYRNIRNIEINLNRTVIFIGENNSGKSNLLRAITLPFLNDEFGNVSKNIGWYDINSEDKNVYFDFITENLEKIKTDDLELEEFAEIIPCVEVEVIFKPDGADEYYIHKWLNSVASDSEPQYAICYRYSIENPKELLTHIISILKDRDSIDDIKMNLLPIELFKYSIVVPMTNEQVSFNDLINFKYNSLEAERDDFSSKNTQLGSKALVQLLQGKLSDDQKVKVEQSYEKFFKDLREMSNLEGIFNWHQHSTLDNAADLFDQITLLPNMPSMNSLLNNVRLGFGDEYLYNQGLGYRNLIYLLVMMNSLELNSDIALNLLTVEEPEAHLCISNERLLASFFNSIVSSSKKTQLFISTHSPAFLNKLDLKNVTVVVDGNAFSLQSVMNDEELNYLAKKPNLDFLKFLFSRKCILVEGPSEEMLIKSYLSLQDNSLNDVEVLSLHKGFTKMLEIWIKVNEGSSHRIGIIRDYDDQPAAQKNHERYNENENIYVTTTREYTLEPEFVGTGTNYGKLRAYFTESHGWDNIDTAEKLSTKWRGAKADTMLQFCRDFGEGILADVELPQHINKVINFLQSGIKE